jgi:glycosyltransferase involved in cell wall biosynthesis
MQGVIGIDYTSAVHQTAGIGRYTREMVAALATQSSDSQYRLFVAEAQDVLLQSRPGNNFKWCPTRITQRWLARLWFRLRLPLPIELWTGRINLFHSPDFFLPPTQPSTRTLVTVHDLSFVREPASVMPGMSRHLNSWVPRSVARADHVIAVSQATRRDLIELYRTSPDKISVLYHGVTADFRPVNDASQLDAVRQKYRLGNQPFILSVGTIQPRKNYQRLIQAFAELPEEYSLVIVGNRGWDYQLVLNEVVTQGLTHRVHFPGFADDADLPALYSAASLFVYPSLYEGFGLPVLEAMACGTPVVAANRSSLPEVVADAGLLVSPTDVASIAEGMKQVLTNTELHRSMTEAGLGRAAKFSWTATAQQLMTIYQNWLN